MDSLSEITEISECVISQRSRHGVEQAVNGTSVWCKMQE
jgi:hypothetical protein